MSRNGREWHTLLDFCAIVGCLVGDRDRPYDPALIDDRAYLGLKGQFNEMELALLRQRSLESRIAVSGKAHVMRRIPGFIAAGIFLSLASVHAQADSSDCIRLD